LRSSAAFGGSGLSLTAPPDTNDILPPHSYLQLPERSGLGIELDEDKLRRYEIGGEEFTAQA
jgi:L-alanine-DL-glutamate epimerase-like enolase superfamily enzyme